MSDRQDLTYDELRRAVDGRAAAIRRRMRLQPAGGRGDKVFPPTYAGGKYALEKRVKPDGSETISVLLDSVQSQANRFEEALLAAYERDELSFPLLAVDFGDAVPGVGRITTLDAPHRIADAIFRDSRLEGVPFRESEIGRAFAAAHVHDATALFGSCPTALLLGVWDSTGSRGGLGNKFARALVSEIVAIDAVPGVRTSSRIDPLGIEKCEIFAARDGGWTADPAQAQTDRKGEPIRYQPRDGKGDKGKPSAINHGNVPPNISETGGVTMAYAEQTTVLSLVGLRKLRFPLDGERDLDRDRAAHAVLAALGLCAATFQMLHGYDLRSRCTLVPEAPSPFEIVAMDGSTTEVHLSADTAAELLERAVDDACSLGLPWLEDPVVLEPETRLVELVRRTRELVAVEVN